MSNSIATTVNFVPILDEIYKRESLTAALDGNNDLVQQGANVKEMKIPKLSMDGLGTYSRSGGYVGGDVTMTLETVTCNYDRGRKFSVDWADNAETANIAFGQLAKEFIRTKVAPEIDAFRFATYAQACLTGSVSNYATAALSTSANVVAALRAAITYLDEKEVPEEERWLYITPTLHGLLDDLDTTKSKNVLERFGNVVRVPQTRFYTKITLYDGTTSSPTDERPGGYVKDSTNGKDINFLCVHRPAVIQYDKHVAPKIITPEANQSADAWAYAYRNLGIADVYENKLTGLYLHYSTS